MRLTPKIEAEITEMLKDAKDVMEKHKITYEQLWILLETKSAREEGLRCFKILLEISGTKP